MTIIKKVSLGQSVAQQGHEQSSQGQAKVWLVSALMGYGHLRAVYPLEEFAHEGIISVGDDENTPPAERRLWKRILRIYELLSRAKGIPLVGKYVFRLLDFFLRIPSFYPWRDLSKSTFQVKMLQSSLRKGLCGGMLNKIKEKELPLVTSFYAPAIGADMQGHGKICCIVCDTDLNRVWVADDPWESRIEYFAPTGRAAARLKAYGVPEQRIHLTGFPLPAELLGTSGELEILKADLGQRLHYLDPNKRFWPLHHRNIEHFLGKENCSFRADRNLTLTFAVGGAGAQKQIGRKIALSLREKLLQGEVFLNLVAGTRTEVKDYFLDVKEEVCSQNIHVIYGRSFKDYYDQFNRVMRVTDILWSKPSELSFYTALGIPIIITPTIGAQERANRKWLREIQAGFRQESPEYTDQWLYQLLNKGRLAEAAWSGFLKARKKGLYNISEILTRGTMTHNQDPIR
ncbi:MAG: DUF6938 domain-containing protein [Bacteroidota bacterium]